MHARSLPVLLLLLAVAAAPAKLAQSKKPAAPAKGRGPATEVHELTLGSTKATFAVPTDPQRITVTKKPAFVFYSIKAGYEPPQSGGAYSTIPAEMSVALVEGSLDEVLQQQRKIYLTASRELVKETKRGEEVIWLVRDAGDRGPGGTKRGFQYVPVEGGVLVIDASGDSVKGMPPKHRQAINTLLMVGLNGIKVGDTPVSTKEIQTHVVLK